MSLKSLGIKTEITKQDFVDAVKTGDPIVTRKLVSMADEHDSFMRQNIEKAGLGRYNVVRDLYDSWMIKTIPIKESDSRFLQLQKNLLNSLRLEQINSKDSISEINRKKAHNSLAALTNPLLAVKILDPRYSFIGGNPVSGLKDEILSRTNSLTQGLQGV